MTKAHVIPTGMTFEAQVEALHRAGKSGVVTINGRKFPYIDADFPTGGAATAAAGVESDLSRRPAAVPEPMPADIVGLGPGTEIPVDRYSENPAITWIRKLLPDAKFVGPAPTFFLVGNLPLFTASGIPPEQLRFVPWRVRHTAALSPDRALVLRLVEEANGPGIEQLATGQGTAALADYFSRCRAWATELPPPETVDDEEYGALFHRPGTKP